MQIASATSGQSTIIPEDLSGKSKLNSISIAEMTKKQNVLPTGTLKDFESSPDKTDLTKTLGTAQIGGIETSRRISVGGKVDFSA
jgi:hypothetical protein